MAPSPQSAVRDPVRIRLATPEDAAPLSAFAARCFREAYRELAAPEDLEAYVAGAFFDARQLAELRDPATYTLVAEGGGAWAGYAQLRWSDPPPAIRDAAAIELSRFYVDRPWQGRGVAQALMRTALEAAAAGGARVAWLGVWQRNPRAVAFYEKSGFRVVGTQPFAMGADVQDDWVMARALDAATSGR